MFPGHWILGVGSKAPDSVGVIWIKVDPIAIVSQKMELYTLSRGQSIGL